MWERTLQDLIKGLRANKKDESKFITRAIEECRVEVKGKDLELKAAALLKLTYLEMLGYDMSWASFHVVEVMSSPRIHLKSVGYLAATQSFNQDTDVLMLTTNLLKKDLTSTPVETAVALNGLAEIVTPDLARDLSQELHAMLNHSRAHVRKRALLALYKVIQQYPDALPQNFARLREKLEDPDPGVVSAAVNVICELARRNPTDYLPLAPQLFHLLTVSSNNWMLIKIIKLFGALTPHEPRLVKKLLPPITELISTTPAISLLYECVHTCIIGGMLEGFSGHSLAKMCVTKLAGFLEDQDQNLKYIALLALTKIVPSHPHLVAEYQNVILASIDDRDISIRMRALDLISAMVNADNLQTIVQQLLAHLVRSETSSYASTSALQSLTQNATSAPSTTTSASPSPNQSPAYRLAISTRILTIAAHDTYARVVDFEWYLSVLVDLAYVAAVDIGKEIRDQLVDICVRVRAARQYAVKLMVKLLTDDTFLLNASDDGSCAEVLWAAAWICGEYCSELPDPQRVIASLLQTPVSKLPPDILAVYVQAAMKVFGYWSAELARHWEDHSLPKVQRTVEEVVSGLNVFASHADIEVQERAAETLQLFVFIRADLNSFRPQPADSLAGGFGSTEPHFPKSLFLIRPLSTAYELNSVGINAQRNVPVPEGLDLDQWFVAPPPRESSPPSLEELGVVELKTKKVRKGKKSTSTKDKAVVANGSSGEVLAPISDDISPEEHERRKAERRERQRYDPYYIADNPPPNQAAVHDIDSIPVVRLDDMPSLSTMATASPGPSSSSPSSLSPPPTSRSRTPIAPFVVDRGGEMPDGAITPTAVPLLSLGQPNAPSPILATTTPSGFPMYDVEETLRTGTPEPITVVRSKKKGTGKKKKVKELGTE